MTRNAILFLAMFAFALTAIGCSNSASNENTGAVSNSNANAAVAVSTSNANAASNLPDGGGGGGAATGNSNIPGIPNIPGADKPISKEDPTRGAKVQSVSRPAPDDSQITTSLGQDLIETRTFKNNAQIAKIEVIGTTSKTVKIYLRNGQVRELPEGKVGDPLSESANNILKVLAAGGTAQSKPENKPTPPAAIDSQKKQ
jgi:hypothetical protein